MALKFRLVLIILLGLAFGWPYIFDYKQLSDAISKEKDQKALLFEPVKPPENLADGAELIYIAAYGANKIESDGVGVVHLKVSRPQTKVVLILCSQHKIRWRLHIEPTTSIVGIIAHTDSSAMAHSEVFTDFKTSGYRINIPIVYEVENRAFKALEARLNQLFGVHRIDAFHGSYGQDAWLSISTAKAINFGPIDRMFFEIFDRKSAS